MKKKEERRRRNPSDGEEGAENENGYWGKLKNSDIVVRKKRRGKKGQSRRKLFALAYKYLTSKID